MGSSYRFSVVMGAAVTVVFDLRGMKLFIIVGAWTGIGSGLIGDRTNFKLEVFIEVVFSAFGTLSSLCTVVVYL